MVGGGGGGGRVGCRKSCQTIVTALDFLSKERRNDLLTGYYDDLYKT